MAIPDPLVVVALWDHRLTLMASLRRYNERDHARKAPGTEGAPFAYFVQTGGRFLYASAIRVVVLKAVVSLSVSLASIGGRGAGRGTPRTHTCGAWVGCPLGAR